MISQGEVGYIKSAIRRNNVTTVDCVMHGRKDDMPQQIIVPLLMGGKEVFILGRVYNPATHQDPREIIGRTFYTKGVTRTDSGGVTTELLPPHSQGYVTFFTNADRTFVLVQLLKPGPKRTVGPVLKDLLTIGNVRIDGDLPLEMRLPRMKISPEDPKPVSAQSSADTKLEKVLTSLFSSIAAQVSALPIHRYEKYLRTPADQQKTAKNVVAAINNCCPNLPAVLMKKNFTFEGVTKAAKLVARYRYSPSKKHHVIDDFNDTTNRTSGVYIRVYKTFTRDSAWKNSKIIFFYPGWTISMDQRKRAHRKDAWNEENSSSLHYMRARAADTWEVYQVAEVFGTEGQLFKDVIEQSIMLLLGSTFVEGLQLIEQSIAKRSRHKAQDEEKPGGEEVRAIVNTELSMLYYDIAKASFKETGYSWPAGRAGFGAKGLTLSSPLGGEHAHDKRAITLTEDARHWYHTFKPRKPQKVDNTNMVYMRIFPTGSYIDSTGVLLFSHTGPQNTGKVPGLNDEFILTVETVKKGILDANGRQARHPKCYARYGNLGSYSNWQVAHRMAIRVDWQKDGQWHRAWLQESGKITYVDLEEQGSLRTYATMSAFHAYLMRSDWTQPQSFRPEYGHATLLKVETDYFRQRVVVSPITKSLETLEGPYGPDISGLVKQLEALGVDHVNGNFGEFDEFRNDPTYYPSGKVPTTGGGPDRRSCCDYCQFLRTNATLAGFPETSSIAPAVLRNCKQATVNGTLVNRCGHCWLRGLPCSWTIAPKLFGQHNWTPKWAGTERKQIEALANWPNAIFAQQAYTDAVYMLKKREEDPELIEDPRYITFDTDL